MAAQLLRSKRLALLLVLSSTTTAPGCEGGSFAAKPSTRTGTGGDPAPALVAKTIDGEPFDLAALHGQVVLLNVWATWCAPCREELPELRSLHEAHADRGFTVVGVSIDRPAALQQVHQMVDSFQLPYPIVFDPESQAITPWNIRGYPTSFIVDRTGTLRWRRDGLIRPDDPELGAQLELALTAAAPAPN